MKEIPIGMHVDDKACGMPQGKVDYMGLLVCENSLDTNHNYSCCDLK